jgi:hypothetical protein
MPGALVAPGRPPTLWDARIESQLTVSLTRLLGRSGDWLRPSASLPDSEADRCQSSALQASGGVLIRNNGPLAFSYRLGGHGAVRRLWLL